jgi:hypothetical protein
MEFVFLKCCCQTRKSSYSKGIQKDSVIYSHKSSENPFVELTPSPQHQRLKESNNERTQDKIQDIETNYCNMGGNMSVFNSESIGFTRNHTLSIKNSKLIKTSSLSSDSTIST